MMQAIDLAGLGLPVFPCDDRKRPVTKHGFLDASRDQRAIRSMFAAARTKLIGVATGTASGCVVVDIDVKDGRAGAAWMREHQDALPVTRTHRTPSGGQHLVFRYPAGGLDIRSTASVVAPGVDTRCTLHPPLGVQRMQRTELATTETTPVEIQVMGVEPSRGTGRLVGLAIVRIEVAGVEITLQGVRIERSLVGLTVHAPAFRHPGACRHVSAVVLPPELRDAIGAEVLAAMGGG